MRTCIKNATYRFKTLLPETNRRQIICRPKFTDQVKLKDHTVFRVYVH